MTESSPISLVCLDLASIVIDDSVVERAFAEAIATQGIVPGTQDYARSMVRFDRSHGRAPASVLRDLFEGDEPRAQAASLAFDRSFRAAAQRFGARRPGPRRRRDGQGGGVGCPRLPHHRAVQVVPAATCSAAPRRRPGALRRRRAPELPLAGPGAHRDARLGTADVREVAVVSATPDGVLSGYRAGARVLVGVGSGSRPARRRRSGRRAPPTCSTASRRFPTWSWAFIASRTWARTLPTLVVMPELPEVEALAAFLREHAERSRHRACRRGFVRRPEDIRPAAVARWPGGRSASGPARQVP